MGLACMLMAFSVEADFKRDYSSGVRDYYGGNYAEAIKSLERAIEEKSFAEEKVRFYGMRYEPYLPYFFLGQSRFMLDDCAGALSDWRKSLAQGVVTAQEDFDELQINLAECEKSEGAPPAALIQAVEDYFEGNFHASAGVDPDAFEDPRAKLQALLFRAASNFNLFLLSGETDRQVEVRYQQDIITIKGINADFVPYAGAFSPRFIDLFTAAVNVISIG
jgi:hypothetical protein